MKALFIILTFFASLSCEKINYRTNFTNSSALSFSLLKTSVDAAIRIHSSINTTNYVVDLSKGFNLEPAGRDSFIMVKEKSLPVSHEDSILIDYDNGKMRVLKSMIITFDTIKLVDQKTVRVIARKIISSDTIVAITLILGRKATGYVCAKCEETIQ